MISPIIAYMAECDVCEKTYEHYNEGWSWFSDTATVKENAENEGWWIDTEINKCYCPNCHEINDDDELIVKEKS